MQRTFDACCRLQDSFCAATLLGSGLAQIAVVVERCVLPWALSLGKRPCAACRDWQAGCAPMGSCCSYVVFKGLGCCDILGSGLMQFAVIVKKAERPWAPVSRAALQWPCVAAYIWEAALCSLPRLARRLSFPWALVFLAFRQRPLVVAFLILGKRPCADCGGAVCAAISLGSALV